MWWFLFMEKKEMGYTNKPQMLKSKHKQARTIIWGEKNGVIHTKTTLWFSKKGSLETLIRGKHISFSHPTVFFYNFFF